MSTGEKFCTGKNCLASAENNYAHSDECLAEYELAINSSPATSPQSMQAALQIIAEKDAQIATQEAQIKALQSDANSWQSGYDKGRTDGAKHRQGEVVQLGAELAAIKAQEPVAWANPDQLRNLDRTDISATCAVWNKSAGPRLPLYAAPVAKPQVVMPERAFKDGTKFSTELKVTGWNACLDEVDRLNGAGVDANHVEHVRAMVVPDGWIACADRLPSLDGAYWCWFGKESHSAIQQRVCIFMERQKQFSDWAVTHWMPLATAPAPGGEA